MKPSADQVKGMKRLIKKIVVAFSKFKLYIDSIIVRNMKMGKEIYKENIYIIYIEIYI